tara:strand:+ start:343 stop:621 length:279 start_codon:yes stop_codon:yes gene_type:complete
MATNSIASKNNKITKAINNTKLKMPILETSIFDKDNMLFYVLSGVIIAIICWLCYYIYIKYIKKEGFDNKEDDNQSLNTFTDKDTEGIISFN